MSEKTTEIYEGSGNVFADLGLEDAEGLYTRAKIWFLVLTILMRGRFNHFSTERLLDFLKKLDQEVILLIRSREASDHQQGVTLSL